MQIYSKLVQKKLKEDEKGVTERPIKRLILIDDIFDISRDCATCSGFNFIFFYDYPLRYSASKDHAIARVRVLIQQEIYIIFFFLFFTFACIKDTKHERTHFEPTNYTEAYLPLLFVRITLKTLCRNKNPLDQSVTEADRYALLTVLHRSVPSLR